ncbi:MAG: bifunctional phosphoribosylaminoimidazolecarboxamide formyltransferase/IMP cyclohydrolase [Spirochaetaceae bacterium]|jgi:phosphoribosylaminoimidazolecarboxamide formyltransferase/IMP cyclohydrolase|nr:bifunctional phosphoribosylaminoimidazolecarboxamide formyltransferase/IMP cyclohydrolase [Spirochaetaceae bacterium]
MEQSTNMKKNALISVYDKEGVGTLASFLRESGWEIFSTGGTARYLAGERIPVRDVSEITGFAECFDGRVKTLHPALYGGILARRDKKSHLDELAALGFGAIDLVCVNLYPFFDKVREQSAEEELLEFIDIGGNAMLRAAAKNYRDVIALTDSADYAAVIADLKAGGVSHAARRGLAAKAFALTAAYDGAVARRLLDDPYPAYWPAAFRKSRPLRYGENSHQSAALYFNVDRFGAFSSSAMEQLGGKDLSYNNIRDIDLAWKAVCAFGLESDQCPPQGEEEARRLLPNVPGLPPVCCVAVKHTTPCGIALGHTLAEAYAKTYACDPVSIYGGIVACNVPVDKAAALEFSDLFLEIIIAPDFEDDALAVLREKSDLRIIRTRRAPRETYECVSVDGGLLVQEADHRLLSSWNVPTRVKPADADVQDMLFGFRAVSFVKSNAIVVVKNHAALGIGSGETNRLWAAELALNRAARAVATGARNGSDNGAPARVLASDAFFPFPDVVELAAATGIKTIIQPGGSAKDRLVVEMCDKLGVAMVFAGIRHFRH